MDYPVARVTVTVRGVLPTACSSIGITTHVSAAGQGPTRVSKFVARNVSYSRRASW